MSGVIVNPNPDTLVVVIQPNVQTLTAPDNMDAAVTATQAALEANLARNAAQASASDADADRIAAEAAQLAAETAETNAEQAEIAAETAQNLAELARDAALASENAAAASETSAASSAAAATSEVTLAETARTGSEAARDAAVVAKNAAETANTQAQAASNVHEAVAGNVGTLMAAFGQAWEELQKVMDGQDDNALGAVHVANLAQIIGQMSDQINGGRVTLAGGTLADPAIRLGTVGIYSSAANTLSVAISGVERLRITASGITVYGTVTEA